MELEAAKKVIKKHTLWHSGFSEKAETANRYYRKENDILFLPKKSKDEETPLRNADNRVPSNFYKLQVNQKAAYAFTTPPTFDVDDQAKNDAIKKALGDSFAKKCKALCVQAANTSVGWLHYWRGEDGTFKYEVINSTQIIPVWTKGLEKELLALLRVYNDMDEAGDEYMVYEYWTDTECQTFRRRCDMDLEALERYCIYTVLDPGPGYGQETNTFQHGMGEVPFIFFNNNDEMQPDLKDIKELIDSYDKVFSGFVNDLEDIQEIIFVLTNYGGEAGNPDDIIQEIKRAKLVQVDNNGEGDKSGLSTLAIEIPTEAREKMLNITRKSIFEQGMAIDPDPQNFGNSSGVALGYLYSLLELKTGMMQTEFMISFNRLIRAILRFYHMDAEKIEQTWTRTSVTNDSELADIAQKSVGVVSKRTIVKNHPWVEDPDDEMDRIEEEERHESQNAETYGDAFLKVGDQTDVEE